MHIMYMHVYVHVYVYAYIYIYIHIHIFRTTNYSNQLFLEITFENLR